MKALKWLLLSRLHFGAPAPAQTPIKSSLNYDGGNPANQLLLSWEAIPGLLKSHSCNSEFSCPHLSASIPGAHFSVRKSFCLIPSSIFVPFRALLRPFFMILPP